MTKGRFRLLGLPALVVFVSACAMEDRPAPPQQTGQISIMTFNVENLFDTTDDPGKNDATYLPLSVKQSEAHQTGCAAIKVEGWRRECLELDWSETALAAKLTAVAAAILQNSTDGKGPDILVLQEVENVHIVERLRREFLAPAQYGPALLIDGNDARGIDVAFLTRLPVAVAPVLHTVEYPGAASSVVADTRGILEATFELPGGELLTGFAVHFPAPFHPAELRVQSYEALAKLVKNLPDGRAVFAAGDFNTTSDEAWIVDQHVAPDWQVAHRLGCEGCRGTYYYARGDDWSFLDMVLVAGLASAGGGWTLEPGKTRVANASPAQTRPDGTPRSFDPVSGSGVSDHWPLAISLTRNADEGEPVR